MAFRQFSTSFYKVGVHGVSKLLSGHPRICRPFAIDSFIFPRHYGTPRLSPVEITDIITKNEMSSESSHRSILYFETNQLASNSPIEDARAEARCVLTPGELYGVFDGHGGPTCSQIIAKRLPAYVAASLLPRELLPHFLQMNISEYISEDVPFLDRHNDDLSLRQDLIGLYGNSFHQFLLSMEKDAGGVDVATAIKNAFSHLDADIAKEAKSTNILDRNLILSIALSGSCASLAHIDGQNLHVASSGDCRVVLGVRGKGEGADAWYANVLTYDHNTANENEISRILAEHPGEDLENIIVNDRLLGMLAPLRAFGDVRFKWDKEALEKYVVPFVRHSPVITRSITPPYLTATPEVIHHKLGAGDAFLILATDGLWDMISPEDAVRLVGEYKSGKTVISPYSVRAQQGLTLGEINGALMKRFDAMKVKPVDTNGTTHLIRYALGGTPEGLDNNRLSGFLTLSGQKARTYRDDITVTIVHFDPEFLADFVSDSTIEDEEDE